MSMRITVRSVGGFGLLISPALFVHLSITVTIQLHDNLKNKVDRGCVGGIGWGLFSL